MAEFLAPQKINPVWKDMLYVEMLWIAHVRKSVKLKQELVQKLQKIVAAAYKILDTKGIFVTIVTNH